MNDIISVCTDYTHLLIDCITFSDSDGFENDFKEQAAKSVIIHNHNYFCNNS